MGIAAYPILVSFGYKGDVGRLPPTHAAFDHAIVGVDIDGKSYWLDATRLSQVGSLEKRQSWSFLTGLPLLANTNKLVAAPDRPQGEIDSAVTDIYKIASFGQPIQIESSIKYYGEWGEGIRSGYESAQKQQMEQSIFDYFPRRFEETAEPTETKLSKDDLAGSTMLSKNWRIPEPFELVEDKLLRLVVIPWSLSAELRTGQTQDTNRPTSIYLGAKRRMRHNIHFQLPENTFKEALQDAKSVKSPFFNLGYKVIQETGSIQFEFDFESLVEQVEGAQVKQFLEKTREAMSIAIAGIVVSVIPLDKIDDVQKKIKELGKKIDRRDERYPTVNQLRAAFEELGITEKLSHGRLTPKNRAQILLTRASARDFLGKHERAMEDYNEAIALNPKSADAHHAKAESLIASGKFTEALASVAAGELIDANMSARNLYRRGRIHYHLGNYGEASKDLEASTKSDTGAGRAFSWLWLDMAQNKLGGDKRVSLQTLAYDIKLDVWPLPLVKYFRGELSDDQLIAQSKDNDDSKQRLQFCEAYFFIGQQFLRKGDTKGAARAFQKSRDTEAREYIEYAASAFELAKLKQ